MYLRIAESSLTHQTTRIEVLRGTQMAQLHKTGRFTTPPDLVDIESLAREACAHMPEELRQFGQSVTIQVLDFPTDDMMDAMDCESPFDMLGLYQGHECPPRDDGGTPDLFHAQNQIALDTQTQSAPFPTDIVYLFRRPILDYWSETGEELAQLVSQILFYEIGYHLGFSDDDIERVTRDQPLLS